MKSKWLVFILLGMYAMTFVGGCGPAGDNGDDVEVATQLRIGGMSMNNNVNMSSEVLLYTSIGCLYLMYVYENLAFYAKLDGEPPQSAYDFVPKLATGYTVSYEGGNQIWEITLREGVKWHDGEDFTADDVVYSMKYVVGKWDISKPIDWDAVERDTDWEEIWSEHVLVEADGPRTVKMSYIDGWHQPEDYIPGWWMWDPMVPKHVFGPDGEGKYDGWNEDPRLWDGESIGTGPFILKEFQADEHMVFERFEGYWGPKPAAETVLFQYFGEPGALFTALEAGAIDVTVGTSVPFPKVDIYRANPDIEVAVEKGLSIYYMGFNLHPTEGYGPLQDKVLRQAIAYAIDREYILEMVFGGYGELSTGLVYKESPNYREEPYYPFNQGTASDLLENAGYYKEGGYWHTPEGEKITFNLTTVSGKYADVSLMITANLQDFGLDVTNEIIDRTTFLQYLYLPYTGGLQTFIYAEDPSPDPWSDWVWALVSDPDFWGYEWNSTWYNNPRFNDLYIENYVAEDRNAKRLVLLEMQEILAEDVPQIYLVRPDVISAARTDRWENWYSSMGGHVTWLNEYSIREVTPK